MASSDGPLDVVAQAEARARDAAVAADEILAQLRESTRGRDGNAARAFGAAYAAASDRAARAERQAVELDEARTRIAQRDGERIVVAVVAALEGLVDRHGLPQSVVREGRSMVSAELREPGSGVNVAREVRPATPLGDARVASPVAAFPGDLTTDGADELDDDDEPVGELAVEVAGEVVDVPAVDAEIPEHELVALAEIPVAWRSRFVFGEDGDLRARIAWTRKVRADEAARAVAAEVAAEAEAEQARAAAAERAARVPGRAPAGWDSRRGGRGRGPAGERAGP